MLVIDDLDDSTLERADALMACEHAAARQVRPELPASFEAADVCTAALHRLCDSAHRGLVATGNGRTLAIMTAAVPENPAAGRYARLPPEGFAVDPDIADPTGVLDLIAEHRALRENGAVHLLATLDGRDVGLLTVELSSPVPRLCPDGQPYIGPTATLPGARGRGVGHPLVDTALTWAHDHDYRWISVDFETANPLSRPFWFNAGFRPAGYGVLRLVDGGAPGQPGTDQDLSAETQN